MITNCPRICAPGSRGGRFIEFGGKPFESALRLSPESKESLRARAAGKPDRFAVFAKGR